MKGVSGVPKVPRKAEGVPVRELYGAEERQCDPSLCESRSGGNWLAVSAPLLSALHQKAAVGDHTLPN